MAGCGGGDTPHEGGHASPSAPSPAQVTTDHNGADITFAQNMIPHHQQAVEMAAMAESRASDPKVKALAAKIKQAQQPEIEQMTRWLTEWGAPLPSMPAPTGGQSGHRGHGDMTGMMTAEEMSAMGAATGAEFDRMFLQLMIRHHQGAVQMAGTEQQQGENAAAKDLAGRIITVQNDEIAQMQAMLANK